MLFGEFNPNHREGVREPSEHEIIGKDRRSRRPLQVVPLLFQRCPCMQDYVHSFSNTPASIFSSHDPVKKGTKKSGSDHFRGLYCLRDFATFKTPVVDTGLSPK